MKCPVSTDENLEMTDRQGIEINYCPMSRVIWLDHGELDKIIERSTIEQPQFQKDRQEERYKPQGHSGKYGYQKKRKVFLGELF